MKPFYKKSYLTQFVNNDLIFEKLNVLPWLEVTPARKEFFMAKDVLRYTYSNRDYVSQPITEEVLSVMIKLNSDGHNYNVCFLNKYDGFQNHLGWHADDSPEMNQEHDIAVVSFGAEREIWWKKKEFKGVVPQENKQLLHNGSLFVMPAGFQKDYFHRIPKADRSDVSTRISLTFRNYLT